MSQAPVPDDATLRRRYWRSVAALCVVAIVAGIVARDVVLALFLSGIVGFSLGGLVLYLDGHRFFARNRLRRGARRTVRLLALTTCVNYVAAIIVVALGQRALAKDLLGAAIAAGILTGVYASIVHLGRREREG